MTLHMVLNRCFELLQLLIFRFKKDMCFLRAAALTFTSALSFVPVLAVMFGIAKGFGLDRVLENTLMREFQDQQEVMSYLIQFGYKLLDQTRGGVIAGIGIITLFYTVLRLLSTIEHSQNSMWGVKKGRTLGRKIVDFLALILLLPLFFIISSSMNIVVSSHVNHFGQLFFVKALKIIPYVLSTLLFTFLYMYMPNTRVRFLSSFLAGIATGIAFQILQASYISIQIMVSKTGAIYGSFAAIPLFLVWLYCSWIIFLFGAEIVVIHQERLWDPEIIAPSRSLTRFEKEVVFVAITKEAITAFETATSPLPISKLALLLHMPVRLVIELLDELEAAKIIFKTNQGIVLARDPQTLRLFDVIEKAAGVNELQTPLFQSIEGTILSLEQQLHQSNKNILIKDMRL